VRLRTFSDIDHSFQYLRIRFRRLGNALRRLIGSPQLSVSLQNLQCFGFHFSERAIGRSKHLASGVATFLRAGGV
jgi:hypothetical protein